MNEASTPAADCAALPARLTEQEREADEIAVALIERNGLAARSIALALEDGVKCALLPDDEWGARYRDSTQRVGLIAASPPRYAEFGGW